MGISNDKKVISLLSDILALSGVDEETVRTVRSCIEKDADESAVEHLKLYAQNKYNELNGRLALFKI